MVPNRPRCSSIAIGASAAQCSLTLHEARKSPLLRSGCPHYSTAHDECQHFCSKLSFRKRHFVSCIGEEPFPLFLGGQHILGFLHESSFLSAYKQLNIFHLCIFIAKYICAILSSTGVLVPGVELHAPAQEVHIMSKRPGNAYVSSTGISTLACTISTATT